jgi:hypothetical protein
MNETHLTTVLPQVTKLCILVLIIPATYTSAERSFSIIKRIDLFKK